MPTLSLPARFQRPPFNGDYYRILGLEAYSNPTSGEIKDAYVRAALIYHPDKVAHPSVHLTPPLTNEEATQCFQAIQEIKSILLSGCAHEFSEDSQENLRPKGASEAQVRQPKNETIDSADQLSPGEQLKAELFAYVRSARFCDYGEGIGPDVRGYWCYITRGADDIEKGRSNFTGRMGIATQEYHVEVENWKKPVIVYRKDTIPFTQVTDPDEIGGILAYLSSCIPKSSLDYSARVYGNHVRDPYYLEATESPITQSARAELSMLREQNPYVLILQTLASTWSTASAPHSQQWRDFVASFNHSDGLEKIEQARIALFEDSVSSRLSPAQVDTILNQLDELEVRMNQSSRRPR